MGESGGRHMAFYPGVIEGVEQLKDKGIRVALVTNKQRSLTVEFLQSVDWRVSLTRWWRVMTARTTSLLPTC